MPENNGRKRFRRSFDNLQIFQDARQAALEVFQLFHSSPEHEEQQGFARDVLLASRTVCAKIASAHALKHDPELCAEALGKAESAAAETLVLLDLALGLGYLNRDQRGPLDQVYRRLLTRLARLIRRRLPREEPFTDDDMPF